MKSFFRRNRKIQAIRKVFIPVYDKIVFYLKNHKSFSGLWAVLTMLLIILIIGLFYGWGVDKNVPGFYFNPEVEKCENPEIENLVLEYYTEYISDKTDVIEYYDEFKIYWVKGLNDNEYAIYVYWELKFPGIDTLAPGIEEFYVVSKDKGKTFDLKSKQTDDEQDFMTQLAETKAVEKLYDKTNEDLEKALKDKKLKALYDFLSENSTK